MITDVFKILNLSTIAICSLSLLYFYNLFGSVKKRRRRPPKFLINLYNVLSENWFFGHFCYNIYRSSYLLSTDKEFSKMKSAIYVISGPILSILVTLLLSILVDKWYFLVAICVLLSLVPLFYFKNKDKKSVILARIDMLNSLNQYTTFISTSDVDTALYFTIRNSTPVAERVFKKFKEDRMTSIEYAYSQMDSVCGDFYISAICKLLLKYEVHGLDKIEEILENSKVGLQYYDGKRLSFIQYVDMGLVTLISLGFAVAVYVMFSFMIGAANSIIFCISLLIACYGIFLSYYYQTNV